MKYNSLIIFLFLLLLIFIIHLCCTPSLQLGEFNGNLEPYTSLKDISDNKFNPKKPKYDSNNYNIVYHDLEADLNVQSGIYKTQKNYYNVLNRDGSMVSIPYYGNENPTLPLYNEPGSFIYGSSNYTPKYEDTVFLSKTTGMSTTRELTPEYNYIGGFCQQYKHSEIELEQKCNSLPKDQCASTTCCVLLGGSKCVSGNERGPYRKANYTDSTIRNKDYYYYKGKCYGRCDNSIREEEESDDDEPVHKPETLKEVQWKGYFTTEENNLLEKTNQVNEESEMSNLNIPDLYGNSSVSSRGSTWSNTHSLLSPEDAYNESMFADKYETTEGTKI